METSSKLDETPKASNSKKKSSSSHKKETTKPESPTKSTKKSSKRLSAKLQQSENQLKRAKVDESSEASTSTSIKEEPKPKDVIDAQSVLQKKNTIVNFIPGNSIEAQNFDGKWISVKIIEVDTDDREVLVRSCDKNNKSKAG